MPTNIPGFQGGKLKESWGGDRQDYNVDPAALVAVSPYAAPPPPPPQAVSPQAAPPRGCLPSLVCSAEHVVDDGHELHDPLIKMEVLQPLEQVRVLAAIAAYHGDLLGLGLSGQYGYFQMERLQRHRLNTWTREIKARGRG